MYATTASRRLPPGDISTGSSTVTVHWTTWPSESMLCCCNDVGFACCIGGAFVLAIEGINGMSANFRLSAYGMHACVIVRHHLLRMNVPARRVFKHPYLFDKPWGVRIYPQHVADALGVKAPRAVEDVRRQHPRSRPHSLPLPTMPALHRLHDHFRL